MGSASIIMPVMASYRWVLRFERRAERSRGTKGPGSLLQRGGLVGSEVGSSRFDGSMDLGQILDYARSKQIRSGLDFIIKFIKFLD